LVTVAEDQTSRVVGPDHLLDQCIIAFRREPKKMAIHANSAAARPQVETAMLFQVFKARGIL
jgi:hypothetical protein